MDRKNDILVELEAKNREIYINKLNIDLDNNYNVLSTSINNVIGLLCSEAINKLLSINMKANSLINKNISSFYISFHEEIKKMLKERNKRLKEIIINIENNDYNSVLIDEENKIINGIKEYYINNIENAINMINVDSDNFVQKRVNDYLKIYNYNNTINKILSVIKNLDIILYNSFRESNKRFKKLNEKTLK